MRGQDDSDWGLGVLLHLSSVEGGKRVAPVPRQRVHVRPQRYARGSNALWHAHASAVRGARRGWRVERRERIGPLRCRDRSRQR